MHAYIAIHFFAFNNHALSEMLRKYIAVVYFMKSVAVANCRLFSYMYIIVHKEILLLTIANSKIHPS